MIGNDIIDLAQARRESNWQRKGFLNKVFTIHEQQLIRVASDPDAMVWTLWSMKESAYKVMVRETGRRFFAPHQLACHLSATRSDVLEGSVFYQKTYYTRTSVTARHIATAAFSADGVQSFTQVIVPFERTDYQHQYRRIRDTIKQNFAARFSIAESRIQVQKNESGVPALVISDSAGRTMSQPISISHHGHYGAFVML